MEYQNKIIGYKVKCQNDIIIEARTGMSFLSEGFRSI